MVQPAAALSPPSPPLPQGAHDALAGWAVGLLLALAFPDGLALLPLRIAAAWPGQVGRAFGNLVTAGTFAPLVPLQAAQVTLLASAASGRALAAALGLLLLLAAAAGLFLAARWLPPDSAEPWRVGCLLLGGSMAATPLAELRGPLFGIGGAAGSVAALEAATGLPAVLWALLATAAVGAATLALFGRAGPAAAG